jgi:transposase-like protein
MTRKQDSANKTSWKELMAHQEDFLKPLIREVLQQVLESEMDKTWGQRRANAAPTASVYRSGYYGRTLITRVGKLELRVPPALSHGDLRAVSTQRESAGGGLDRDVRARSLDA